MKCWVCNEIKSLDLLSLESQALFSQVETEPDSWTQIMTLGPVLLVLLMLRAGRRAERTLISAGLNKVELCSVCLSAEWTEPDQWWWMVLVTVQSDAGESGWVQTLQSSWLNSEKLKGRSYWTCGAGLCWSLWEVMENTRTQNIYRTCTCTPAEVDASSATFSQSVCAADILGFSVFPHNLP